MTDQNETTVSFWEKLRKNKIDVKVQEGDEVKVEWLLWKHDRILFDIITGASLQFEFNRFLIKVEEERKICSYSGDLDRIEINLYHNPKDPEFTNALQIAGRLAQQLSPGIRELEKSIK